MSRPNPRRLPAYCTSHWRARSHSGPRRTFQPGEQHCQWALFQQHDAFAEASRRGANRGMAERGDWFEPKWLRRRGFLIHGADRKSSGSGRPGKPFQQVTLAPPFETNFPPAPSDCIGHIGRSRGALNREPSPSLPTLSLPGPGGRPVGLKFSRNPFNLFTTHPFQARPTSLPPSVHRAIQTRHSQIYSFVCNLADPRRFEYLQIAKLRFEKIAILAPRRNLRLNTISPLSYN